MTELDEAWESFCDNTYTSQSVNRETLAPMKKDIPKCSDIYISTKTKIAFLSQPIELFRTFWRIPIIDYHIPNIGVIKKQMKFISNTEEELESTLKNLDNQIFYEQNIISRIPKTDGRNKYKDVRKISIGLCKKDITSYKCKKKGAFYNCFALILRIKIKEQFKEVHVKVFNTGKLEIPGIQDEYILADTLNLLCSTINECNKSKIAWDKHKIETVLINSNFTCGYYIDRNKLYQILKFTYGINSAYDPCSYPGIQCEFYYNVNSEIQTGKPPNKETTNNKDYIKISFMVFRTGSVLIVGKCSDNILMDIYQFIKNLLETEYVNINSPSPAVSNSVNKIKKIRRKTITIHTE